MKASQVFMRVAQRVCDNNDPWAIYDMPRDTFSMFRLTFFWDAEKPLRRCSPQLLCLMACFAAAIAKSEGN